MKETECVDINCFSPPFSACGSLTNLRLWFPSYYQWWPLWRSCLPCSSFWPSQVTARTHASINPFSRGRDLETFSWDCAENKLFVLAVLIYFVEYIAPPWIIMITLLSGGVDTRAWNEGYLKVREDFGLVSIVSYCCPSLMIIAPASQFHIYLPWGKCLFSIVS